MLACKSTMCVGPVLRGTEEGPELHMLAHALAKSACTAAAWCGAPFPRVSPGACAAVQALPAPVLPARAFR